MLHSATKGASPYAVAVTNTTTQKQNIKNTLS